MPGKDSRRGDRAASDHAARLELRRRFGRLLESLDRTLAALERAATPAAVHGARVLARRLRMLLRVFLRASAPTAVDREIEALRQIGHYLDAVREADVARQEIAQLAAKCGSTATQEIAALIAGKGRERKRAERILKAYLHRTSWSDRITKLRELVGNALLTAARPQSIEALASRQFEKRRRRLLKALRRKRETPSQLHRLRLKIKFMRYLCEELSWASEGLRNLQIKQLRALQTCLGDWRDGWQLQEFLLSETRGAEAAHDLASKLALEQRVHLREFHKRRKMLLRAWRKKLRS